MSLYKAVSKRSFYMVLKSSVALLLSYLTTCIMRTRSETDYVSREVRFLIDITRGWVAESQKFEFKSPPSIARALCSLFSFWRKNRLFIPRRRRRRSCRRRRAITSGDIPILEPSRRSGGNNSIFRAAAAAGDRAPLMAELIGFLFVFPAPENCG